MAVASKNKRKITVGGKEYLWRVHPNTFDLEIINPFTRRKISFERLKIKDQWSTSAQELLDFWEKPESEVVEHDIVTNCDAIKVAPKLVAKIIQAKEI